MGIVVTGHKGFIGSHLIKKLKGATGVDIKSGDDVLTHDFSDADVIIHLAAEPEIQETIKEPFLSFFLNVVGTVKILEEIRENGGKIVFASSSQADADAQNPYALHKYTCEKFIRLYGELYGVKYTILRLYNVFGPGGHTAVEKMKFKAILDMPIDVNGGKQVRDFIHVDAVVEEFKKAIKKDGEWEVGSGEGISIQELADLISDNQKLNPMPEGEPMFLQCKTKTKGIGVKEYLK